MLHRIFNAWIEIYTLGWLQTVERMNNELIWKLLGGVLIPFLTYKNRKMVTNRGVHKNVSHLLCLWTPGLCWIMGRPCKYQNNLNKYTILLFKSLSTCFSCLEVLLKDTVVQGSFTSQNFIIICLICLCLAHWIW